MVAAYAYAAFGLVAARTGDGDGNPFTFVGAYGVMDEGDGLYYMRSRYYDAHTARFCQPDTIGYAGGPNLYSYAANNPVTLVDAEGTVDPSTIVLAAALAAIAMAMWNVHQKT